MSTQYFDNKTAFLEPTVTQYGSRMVMTNVTKPKKIKYINGDKYESVDPFSVMPEYSPMAGQNPSFRSQPAIEVIKHLLVGRKLRFCRFIHQTCVWSTCKIHLSTHNQRAVSSRPS